MTNADLTLIAVLLDRSGSMFSIKSDTEGGFDAYIAKQREQPGGVHVTLAQFDDVYERVYSNVPIENVAPLVLEPRGVTALYDGIGRLTTEIGQELAARPEHERPGKVIVVVLTDGHENASKEWTHSAVREVITRQERDYAWDYLFLGANIDAVAIGEQLGFKGGKSLTYAPSAAGVSAAFAAAANYTSRKRAAAPGAAVEEFTDADRSSSMQT
ncbi:vWA domain-containing protein [Antrihabitans sp. YC2-6]|uniref:vWA domain-containing protein n=1 Tax=Antrihabitans sp. YC2-6 TaxID=2799498 RepID=UPI0018F5706D|nr:vWA domain-containing protein [Antrihabitans sp. YC2-6]MBJ8348044.1 VWA domain-containing protein [Antrihabitans sp. YC2-6]